MRLVKPSPADALRLTLLAALGGPWLAACTSVGDEGAAVTSSENSGSDTENQDDDGPAQPSADDDQEPEPSANEPEPSAAEPEPNAAEPEPSAAEPEPRASEPEAGAAEPEPNVGEPEPSAADPEPRASEPEAGAAEPEPNVGEPEPTVSEPDALPGSFGKCTNGVPYGGDDTGYFSCDEGYQHRKEAKTCSSALPRSRVLPSHEEGDAGTLDQCFQDSDCAGPHGYCDVAITFYGFASGEPYYECQQGCVDDAECGDGQACLCGDPIGVCVPATCRTDGDCDDGGLCVNIPARSCGDGFDLACQRLDDACRSTSDCVDEDCSSPEGGPRECTGISVCGRPFLVASEERRAGPSSDGSYAYDVAPQVEHLAPAVRARLAEHWTEIALMEHASIAAFARFTLQLLACGAPVALVEASNRAIADETRHARACFALATAYRGAPVGPGELELSGALDENSLEAIVRMVIREGCVGETQAALEAAEALQGCEDPVVAEVLQRIAAEEAQHAELAWRFVQWADERHPALRAVVRTEFHRAIAERRESPARPRGTAASSPPSNETSLARYGVLDAKTRAAVHARALAVVVAPCAERLLQGGASAVATARGEWLDA